MGTVYTFLLHLMSYIEGLYSSHESGENTCGMTAGSSVRNEQTALLMSVDHHTHTHTHTLTACRLAPHHFTACWGGVGFARQKQHFVRDWSMVAQVPAYLVNLLTHLMWDVAGLEANSPRLPHLMAELMIGPLRPFLGQKHTRRIVYVRYL